MIITLSPAKTLDFETPIGISKSTESIYLKDAAYLNKVMTDLSVEEIASLMSINTQIAQNVYQYVYGFNAAKVPQRQAVFAYNGIAYHGLDAHTLTDGNLDFAQKHLNIISGMYGLLRPLDEIKPYRLEMQIQLANKRGVNLYEYWSETLSRRFAEQMKADDNIWVNLSSKEYTKVINRKLLPKNHRVITPIFKESRGEGYKQIVVYAKKARGMMTRFIIQNEIENIEYLKGFDTDGYTFSSQLSSEDEWVFIR